MKADVKVDEAEEILKGFKLPPRPSIFIELKQASKDLKRMASVVETDPALSASILKVINSPAIGIESKVTSVSHAMNLLGLRSIMNIINAAFLKRAIGDLGQEGQMEHFWRSSTKVATAMAVISRKLNFSQYKITSDDAYCIGLFHNVGMPMLLEKHSEYFETIKPAYLSENVGLIDAENHLFDTNHTVLGYYMTKGWGLPKYVSEVIQLHHRLETFNQLDELEEQVAMLLCALKMSEQIAGEFEEFGEVNYNKEWVVLSEGINRYLGLSTHDFFDIEDFIFDTFENEKKYQES